MNHDGWIQTKGPRRYKMIINPIDENKKSDIITGMKMSDLKRLLGSYHEITGSGVARCVWYFNDKTCLVVTYGESLNEGSFRFYPCEFGDNWMEFRRYDTCMGIFNRKDWNFQDSELQQYVMDTLQNSPMRTNSFFNTARETERYRSLGLE